MMRKRHVHDLSSYKMFDTNAGLLTPIGITECLPNDTFKGNTEAIIRLSALNRPVMHPLKAKIFHFFVPTRLVWPEWDKFITQGKYGSTPPAHPYINVVAADAPVTSFLNQMGVKTPQGADSNKINALPVSAFNLICNTFFADEDLTTARARSDASGNRTGLEDITNFNVNWKKDYITTSRPWAQKSTSVPIPQSNIITSGADIHLTSGTAINQVVNTIAGGGALALGVGPVATQASQFGDATGLEMDDSAKMRDLSLAGALQLFFENRAENGSRFVEYLRSAFGSKVYDSTLQNPQLVNYSEKTIQFSEVIQTAEGVDPVGTLRGHGVGGLGSNKFKYYMGEHGWFITMAYIMPEPMYLSTMERFWFKENFYDYFQPEFEAIGQQPIWTGEVFGSAATATRKATWSYQDRYGEYMRTLNQVSGLFETTNKDWHMARDLAGTPTLNESFLAAAPTTRIFADESAPGYQLMVYHNLIARRNVKRHVRKRIL